MTPTVNRVKNIILRTDVKNTAGESPIILRLKINGRKFEKTLGVYCHPDHWDDKTRSARRSCPVSGQINDLVNSTFSKVYEITYKYKTSHKTLNKEDLERELNISSSSSFIELVEREISTEKKLGRVSPGTISNYAKDLSKLKRYKASIDISEITVTFLKNYRIYMVNTLKNGTNTVNRTERFIRNFMNRARLQGLTESYPFDNYRLKTGETQTNYLTELELQSLQGYYNSLARSHKHKRTLLPYLFSCYTGLRYSDIEALRNKDINGKQISIQIKKTARYLTIPLNDPAVELLNEHYDNNYFSMPQYPGAPVIKVPCNQTVNRALKEIAARCKIKKKLTFHTSRHTFATLSISLGVGAIYVKDFLGHSSLKQTEHYIKIVGENKNKEMQKFNELFKLNSVATTPQQ